MTDATSFDPEVNRLHPPGVIEAKQTGVMRFECVHFGTLPNRRPSMNRPRRATEIPEEPGGLPTAFRGCQATASLKRDAGDAGAVRRALSVTAEPRPH